MSTIVDLGISGLRSYSNKDMQRISFLHPLTLIWGKNGAGKTAIIEALRFVICGQVPPNTDRGKHFLLDPSIAGEADVVSQVKLRFRMANGLEIKASKICKLSLLKGSRKSL